MTDDRLFLTQVRLDTRKRSVRTAVGDPRDLHRCLMKALPDGLGSQARATARALYRIERDGQSILVQSSIEPTAENLPDGFTARTIEVTPMLDRLNTGLIVRYECVATPVKREKPTGREIGLKGADAEAWWLQRCAAVGLAPSIDDSGNQALLIEDRAITVRRWRTIGFVSFTGLAAVSDVALLRTAVQSGIGRNKNWGAGMLSLAPAESAL